MEISGNLTMKKDLKICLILCLVVLAQGCLNRETKVEPELSPVDHVLKNNVTFQIPKAEKVWGIGIVGNLPGTGSSVCPPKIRAQLRRMMSSTYTDGIDLDAFIRSPNTAVVYIEGEIQGSAIKSDRFDIQVQAYDNSGQCDIAGGWLYRTDLALSKASNQVMLQTVATAEGAIFKPKYPDKLPSKFEGLVLGGGTVVAETATHLTLTEPGFKKASLIRNLINARFGYNTAQAMSPAQIDVRVPDHYRKQRWRFWATVEALPLSEEPDMLEARVAMLIEKMVQLEDLEQTEIALEAMGGKAVPQVSQYLMQDNPDIQLSAARCLSYLGDVQGLTVLSQIAASPQHPKRVQAMHALKSMTHIPQIQQLIARLLADSDLTFAMDVYESLCMEEGVGVEREAVAGIFSMDTVRQNRTQAVVATRSGGAYLALFGSPIHLKPGQLIEFPKKKIILDSRANNQYVMISRHTNQAGVVTTPVKCAGQLRDLIRVLCDKPGLGDSQGGFGLSYSDILELIGQLSDRGMIPAELWAGPLPKAL